MACVDVRCGGKLNQSLDCSILGGIYRRARFPSRNGRRPCFVKIGNRIRTGGAKAASILTAVAATTTAIPPRRNDLELELFGDSSRGNKSENRESAVANTYERLDGWMRASVAEIVKNLEKAPLFVHVYSENAGEGNRGTRLKTEKAVAEDWRIAKQKWEKGQAPSPEGVIFVEELKDDEQSEDEDGGDGTHKAWGVVVQGKGSDCPPACYLLKTSSCRSLGVCCTHFCLVKVANFRETTASQLKNFWLVPGLQ